jgi:hypothetical protein
MARGVSVFSAQGGKTLYCIRFEHPLWNPLQIKLKLDKHAPQRAITARPHIGGISRDRSVLAGAKMNPRHTKGCSQNLPEL